MKIETRVEAGDTFYAVYRRGADTDDEYAVFEGPLKCCRVDITGSHCAGSAPQTTINYFANVNNTKYANAAVFADLGDAVLQLQSLQKQIKERIAERKNKKEEEE